MLTGTKRIWMLGAIFGILIMCLISWTPFVGLSQDKAPREKPLPPIDVRWEVTNTKKTRAPSSGITTAVATSYAGTGRVRVNIDAKSTRFFALDGGTALNLQITTQGDVIVPQNTDRHLLFSTLVRDIAANPKSDKVPFEIAEGKRGVVIAEASAASFDGKTQYGRRAYLYLIAGKRKLYVGTSSFMELDIQKLKDDLGHGVINKQQYDTEMQRLLGGGAIESNEPRR